LKVSQSQQRNLNFKFLPVHSLLVSILWSNFFPP